MLGLNFNANGSSGVASDFKCSVSICTNFGLKVNGLEMLRVWDISKAKTSTY